MTEFEIRLHRVEQALLAHMESVQESLPDDVEATSEALERHARIIALLIRGFDVLRRAQPKNTALSPEQTTHKRQALIAEIEQKLARLAQAETAPPTAEQAER